MGLPVWRAPSPADSKDAIKVDLAASARSPIRRRVRSPVVGGRRAAAASAAPRRSGNAHATLAGPQRSRRLNDFLESSLAERRADNSRGFHDSRLLSDARPLFPPPPVPESRHYARDSGRDYARESLGMTTRDRDPSTGRPHPLRRPSDRRAPAAASSSRVPVESGTRSFGLFGYRIPALRSSIMGSSWPLPFTPNFAPADYAATQGSTDGDPHQDRGISSPDHTTESSGLAAGRGTSPHREAPMRSSRSGRNILVLDDLDDGNNAVGFPPLQRMGRRPIADGPLPLSSLRESWSPATTTLDGLGDRERSFSPIEDGDGWDTMLSTVAPDPFVPTADSSFTSAAASASFSNSHPSSRSGSANSNSVSSSRTHLTVPSRRHSGDELFVRVCDTSEDDSPSDTEVEEDNSHTVRARRPMPWGRTLPADDPPSRSSSRYSRNVRDQSLDSSRFVRNFYSFARSAAQDVQRESTRDEESEDLSLDSELQEARAILERLSRRDDISDEFWASVGLTPPLAERVERIHQRERL